ncbi:hypothetical protein Tco_1420935 [Tanacetum coccineum]
METKVTAIEYRRLTSLCGDPSHLFRECPKPPKDKNQRAFVGGSWSDSGEEYDEKVKDKTCLMAQASNKICLGVDLELDEWIKDSGCSKHMTGQICDNKCKVTFSEHDSEITKDGKVIGRGTEEHNEGTKEQREGTEEKVESTAGQIKDTKDQTMEEIASKTSQTSTSMIFGDDETIATLLLNISQAKAASKEKEKGVELKDVEEIDIPRPTSTRSLLTLKPLPKIDPKDKRKKKMEEEDEFLKVK